MSTSDVTRHREIRGHTICIPLSAIDYYCQLRLDVGSSVFEVATGCNIDVKSRKQLPTADSYSVRRGMPLGETATYRRPADYFDGNEEYRGYGSLEMFRENRLPYIHDLYESIETDAVVERGIRILDEQ